MILLKKYKNKNIAVLGLGKTGLSIINTMISSGANVFAWDDNDNSLLSTQKIYPQCHYTHPNQYNWDKILEIIISPGIPISGPNQHWIINRVREAGCKVSSDIELLWESQNKNSKFICVTGTNGKSTTTALIGHIDEEIMENVERNLLKRMRACIRMDGGHFEHLL